MSECVKSLLCLEHMQYPDPCRICSTRRAHSDWIATYLMVEIGCSAPIMHALSTYWNWVRIAYYEGYFHTHKYREPGLNALMVQLMSSNLCYIQEQTPELCALAVARCGNAIRYVQDQYLTLELYVTAVKQSGQTLAFIASDILAVHPELYEIAVAQNGMALQYVPRRFRTPALYLTAVTQNGMALQYIQKKYRTRELCAVAVAQTGQALWWVKRTWRTPELCLSAVATWGFALQWVPLEYRTPPLCMTAVTHIGYALLYIPNHTAVLARYPNLYEVAVAKTPTALQYVQQPTFELCMMAVKRQGWAVKFVSEAMQHEHPEICIEAVRQNPRNLGFITHPKIRAAAQ